MRISKDITCDSLQGCKVKIHTRFTSYDFIVLNNYTFKQDDVKNNYLHLNTAGDVVYIGLSLNHGQKKSNWRWIIRRQFELGKTSFAIYIKRRGAFTVIASQF